MRTLALAIAAVLLLASCSADPGPIEPTAPAPANAPSPPAQAEQDTPDGAAAFVGYYIEVMNFAARTGDVSPLTAHSSHRCDGCQDYIDLYEGVYEAGGHFKGGEWSASNFELEIRETTTDVFVHIEASKGRMKADASGGSRTEEAFYGDVVFEVDTRAKDRKVHRLERLEP